MKHYALVPQALLGFLAVGAVAVGCANQQQPQVAAPTHVQVQPLPVPTWTDAMATQHPGCERLRHGKLYARVLVSDVADQRVHVLPMDRAWTLAQDWNGSNDVWVLGGCR